MKKFILSLIIGFITLYSLTSCVTGAYAQTEGVSDDVDVTLVVSLGTPYYLNGNILYYLYDGYYYYPHVRNNITYYHRYQRPLPMPGHRHHLVPMHHRHNATAHRPPVKRPNSFARNHHVQRQSMPSHQRQYNTHRYGGRR